MLLLFVLTSCASNKGVSDGVATWYGPGFHGKQTSSGEVFDMNAITCAHRDYPFGTKVKVTNKQNRKEVICTVNDRGPFVSGRDIDLSYGAAKEIGLLGMGVADVVMEPLGRDTSYVKEVIYRAARGALTIQVGAFREEEHALKLRRELELKYEKVYIMEIEKKGTRFFRVRIGRFRDQPEAFRTGKALADEGYEVLITEFEQNI
ncbi:MAG: septal ring lytic transglycosylase RlpA family protein [Nitrospirales bacterium]|nr:septal ring lytic transglycosylase RlpA family protein [Nitrospirales bacterium]